MSGRLVKVMDGVLHIAYTRVAAPGYTLYTADFSADGTVSNGWTYYAEPVEHADFALPWAQPTGAHDAYDIGVVVSHNGTRWRSVIVGNVWEPGVSGWVDADSDVPAWVQPTGAHDAYVEGAVVSHAGKLWRNVTTGTVNTWEPGVSGWREAMLMPPDGTPPAPPAWVQPTGAHDAYQIGDRVTHNAQAWTSTVADNVWEPGVYGWVAD